MPHSHRCLTPNLTLNLTSMKKKFVPWSHNEGRRVNGCQLFVHVTFVIPLDFCPHVCVSQWDPSNGMLWWKSCSFFFFENACQWFVVTCRLLSCKNEHFIWSSTTKCAQHTMACESMWWSVTSCVEILHSQCAALEESRFLIGYESVRRFRVRLWICDLFLSSSILHHEVVWHLYDAWGDCAGMIRWTDPKIQMQKCQQVITTVDSSRLSLPTEITSY